MTKRMWWFRSLDKALDDPRLQQLRAETFKVYINLLYLSNRQPVRGTLPKRADIAFALRITSTALGRALAELEDAQLLDQGGGSLFITDRADHFVESDNVSSRVADWRRRREETPSDGVSNATRNTDVTLHVTPQEQESQIEQDSEQKQTHDLAESARMLEFDARYSELKELYPARNGKRVGIDTVAKEEASKIELGEWPDLLKATRNYAASGELPVDPIRWFKSRDYPRGLWHEWVNVPQDEGNEQARQVQRNGGSRYATRSKQSDQGNALINIFGRSKQTEQGLALLENSKRYADEVDTEPLVIDVTSQATDDDNPAHSRPRTFDDD